MSCSSSFSAFNPLSAKIASLRAIPISPGLRFLKIRGASMEPVLSDGDAVMINIMDGITSLPAIFALFDGVGIMVKQIEVIPDSGPILARISTANTQSSAYQRNLNDIRIIGRVIWFSRSLSH